MHHLQQQQTASAAHHQFHPYLPPPHHRLQQHINATTNQQQRQIGTSKIIKSCAGPSSTAASSPVTKSTVTKTPVTKTKAVPLGASSSYHIASNTITQFYQFRETPNLIARTNHSTVHKVFSRMYNREVAVKIIDKRAIPASLVDKFLPRELEITRIVHHPHLVRCLHIIQPHHTKVAIISEFYSGGTLLQYVLNRNQLTGAEGARIFRQLCEAIYYLHHTLGVVHRPYSAPQLVQQKPYDPYAADWYASGVVLYTMLCGKWPHEPKAKCMYPLEYPEKFDPDASKLINKLMNPDEFERGGYYDIINSEWMKKLTNGKWIFTDDLFIYDIQSPLV
uniref:Protein kinase domain-containing protein n=1 Tax=Panagrolaimus sp. ES5 TaxID=591445 RepID=A0AC34F8V6_9BILA